MRNRVALIVFLIGAAGSLWFGWISLRRILDLVGTMFGRSGGIGAIAGSFAEPVVALVALAIVLLLAAYARKRGTLARRLARIHRYTSFGVVAIALLLIPAEFVQGWGDLFQDVGIKLLALSFICFSLFLPWQAFCASAFVAFLISKPSSSH